MRQLLRLMVLSVVFFGLSANVIAGDHKNKTAVKEDHVYYEKGMRHHLVVMNEKRAAELGLPAAGGVIDTITHANVSAPEDEGIQSYAGGGAVPDTVVNWYWFAADTAEIREIHASFVTTGTGSWNVWGNVTDKYRPKTSDYKLLLDVPWTITQADTNADGSPSSNLQVLDLYGQGLSAEVAEGCYVGEYFDGTNGPKMFMDDGNHLRSDAGWGRSLMYIASFGNWYSWATSTTWTEFIQQIVVFYKKVAPLVEHITYIPDFFEGNPYYPSVEATIFDLDGTVATADLVFQVGAGAESRVAMTPTGDDVYSGNFGTTFPGGEIVTFWIETTDDEGNFRATSSSSFEVVTPPAQGTDIFYVNQGGQVDGAFDAVLDGKDVFSWDVNAHGGITSYEINWGFDNILWYGFGSSELPSPFETDDQGIKDYLNDGGHLMIVDADYLFIHGYDDSVLAAGQFGFDYLGLVYGLSDVGSDDSVHFGVDADPISGSFVAPADSFVTMPETFGVWNADYETDWMDYIIPNDNATGFMHTGRSAAYGYDTAIRFSDGNFATALYTFRLEASDEAQLQTVLDNTLTWFNLATAVDDDNSNLVSGYRLAQNYPNPFNPTTTINFTLAKKSTVKLIVYNTLGAKIAEIINEDLTAGEHQAVWNGLNADGQKVASGLYYYKLSADDYSAVRKMLLVK